MTDHIIKAAKEAGMTTGDNQKHNGVYWWRSLGRPTNVSTTDLERFYAIAYRAGLEDAAKVCEAEWSNPAEKLYGQDCATVIRALMKETP